MYMPSIFREKIKGSQGVPEIGKSSEVLSDR